MSDIKPGQLWEWRFSGAAPGSNGWWIAHVVSNEARTSIVDQRHVSLYTGARMLILSINDPGPSPGFMDLSAMLSGVSSHKRYHTALFDGTVIWAEHDWLTSESIAALIMDV